MRSHFGEDGGKHWSERDHYLRNYCGRARDDCSRRRCDQRCAGLRSRRRCAREGYWRYANVKGNGAMTIGVGVIGYGYWGPNLVRNFMETPGFAVRAISDLSDSRGAIAAARWPGAKITADYRDLLKDPSIDAIVVATPVHA